MSSAPPAVAATSAAARDSEHIPAAFAPGLVLRIDPAGRVTVVARGPEAPTHVSVPAKLEDAPGLWPAELVAMVREGVDVLRLDLGDDRVEVRMRNEADGHRWLQFRTLSEADELRQALARAREELQQFAYAASHDLQEPLRTVASFCELLRRRYRGRLDGDADTFIDFTVDAARRMQALLQALLDFSRVVTRGGPLVPVDLGPILARACDGLASLIDEKGARVEIAPLPRVRGDARQLMRLFRELLHNALLYHGERPPEVTVAGVRDGAHVRIWVRDRGIGIAPEFHERIFRIFQRLHSRDEIPGIGAGLAIARRIAERHGGGISVQSEAGRGATFVVVLPAA